MREPGSPRECLCGSMTSAQSYSVFGNEIEGANLPIKTGVYSPALCRGSKISEGGQITSRSVEGRCNAIWKREFKLPRREAGPPNHLNDKLDSDQ